MPQVPSGGWSVITVYKDGREVTTGPYHFIIANLIAITAVMSPHVSHATAIKN